MIKMTMTASLGGNKMEMTMELRETGKRSDTPELAWLDATMSSPLSRTVETQAVLVGSATQQLWMVQATAQGFFSSDRGGVTSSNLVASITWSMKIVSGTSLVSRNSPI